MLILTISATTFQKITSILTTSTTKYGIFANHGKSQILIKILRNKPLIIKKFHCFISTASLNKKIQKYKKKTEKDTLSPRHGTSQWASSSNPQISQKKSTFAKEKIHKSKQSNIQLKIFCKILEEPI